jgi:hypothetical protein
MRVPGSAVDVWAYLCPVCSARCGSEEGIRNFLDAALERNIESLWAKMAAAG